MGGKDSNYTIVYRGDTLARMQEGGWVIFQRAKAYGGGFVVVNKNWPPL